jgi:hypothetical protein
MGESLLILSEILARALTDLFEHGFVAVDYDTRLSGQRL